MVELGMTVRDKISGFSGIATAIGFYKSQANRITITSRKVNEIGTRELDFDENQVEILSKKKVIDVKGHDCKFAFGQKVKDPDSGYVGVVVGYVRHLNGCISVHVRPKHKEGSDYHNGVAFHQDDLKAIGPSPKTEAKSKNTGGPVQAVRSSRVTQRA